MAFIPDPSCPCFRFHIAAGFHSAVVVNRAIRNSRLYGAAGFRSPVIDDIAFSFHGTGDVPACLHITYKIDIAFFLHGTDDIPACLHIAYKIDIAFSFHGTDDVPAFCLHIAYKIDTAILSCSRYITGIGNNLPFHDNIRHFRFQADVSTRMDVLHVIHLFVLIQLNDTVAAGFHRQVLLRVKGTANINITGFADNGDVLFGCCQLTICQDVTVFTENIHTTTSNIAGYNYIAYLRLIGQFRQISGRNIAFHNYITIVPFVGLGRVNLYRSVFRVHVAFHKNIAASQGFQNSIGGSRKITLKLQAAFALQAHPGGIDITNGHDRCIPPRPINATDIGCIRFQCDFRSII